MASQTVPYCLLLFLLIAAAAQKWQFAEAKIHITDDLDDVVDDEEDDEWREWGKKKSQSQPDKFDPPPTDFGNMGMEEMQEEMMKRTMGPVFGFAKLRPGNKRTREMVTDIAMKWTKVARTGGIEAKFMGVDLSTIMVTLEKGQDALELKDFLLSQDDAYEIKIGDQLFRRPGDPPLDEVFEKLQAEKSRSDETGTNKDERHGEL